MIILTHSYYSKIIKKFKQNQKQKAGRNNTGTITLRHRGGGFRNTYIRYNKYRISPVYSEFVVLKILYDPNRSGLLALIANNYGIYQFILAPEGIKVGSVLFYTNSIFTRDMLFAPGTNAPLSAFPTGSRIFNVEQRPGQGGVYAKAAGCFAKLMIKKRLEKKMYAGVRLPSKKLIYLPLECHAFFGRVSNASHKFKILHKAGIRRNWGFRPSVRGVAMNPVDHPHGGGEGKASTGPRPKTPWGKPAKWKKTTTVAKQMKSKIFISKMNKLAVSLKTKKMRSAY